MAAATESPARPCLNSAEQVQRWREAAVEINKLGNMCHDAQYAALASLVDKIGAARVSLCNSAGITLGKKYHFDLTRPGISLYGGAQVEALAPHIRQVAFPEAQVIQRRRVEAGQTVGYGGTFRAEDATELAILHLGYADGYLRGFSGTGGTHFGDAACPVVGRVSMDLIAVSVDAAPDVKEGDWLSIDYDLPTASAQSGLSQYELLTTLGRRYQRNWNE